MDFPIEMYKIRLENITIKVPCERCAGKGIVDYGCHKCGGNGIHKKTINVWKVAPRKEKVVKIDRSSKDNFYSGTQTSYKGGLRYWTSLSEFYNEEDKYLHFTKEDAQQECDARNKENEDILKVFNSNKTKQNNKEPKYSIGQVFYMRDKVFLSDRRYMDVKGLYQITKIEEDKNELRYYIREINGSDTFAVSENVLNDNRMIAGHVVVYG